MCPEKSLIHIQSYSYLLKCPEKLAFKMLFGFGGLYYPGDYFGSTRRDLTGKINEGDAM